MAAATFLVGATTATFALLMDGADLEQSADVNVRHIPGGDVNYVDSGGLNALTLPCRVKLATFADLYALMLLVGQSGTLTYSETPGDTRIFTCRLRSCKRSRAVGTGVQFASLDFLISAVLA